MVFTQPAASLLCFYGDSHIQSGLYPQLFSKCCHIGSILFAIITGKVVPKNQLKGCQGVHDVIGMRGHSQHTYLAPLFKFDVSQHISFSKTDREGVDTLQLYVSKGGLFYEIGAPFVSEYVQKLKQ